MANFSQRYHFPPISTTFGVINIYVDSVSAGLTMPTWQTIKNIGIPWTETANIDLTSQEIARLSFEVRDDHSVYPEGFWVGLLYVKDNTGNSGSFFIATITPPGGSETCFFHGLVETQTVQADIIYSTNVKQRIIKFTCLSTLKYLYAIPTSDWVANVVTNGITTATPAVTGTPWKVSSVLGLFASMLNTSGTTPIAYDPLNPTFNENDISFQRGTQDLFFKDGSANNRDVSQLMVPVTYYSAGSSPSDYFNSGNANCLATRFPTLGALIPKILRNFGLLMTMSYDFANSRFKITLLQRRRAYSTEITFPHNGNDQGRLQNRGSSIATTLTGDAVRISYLLNSSYYVWMSKKWSNNAFYVVDPSNYPGVQFDLDDTIIWHICATTTAGPTQQILCAATIPSPGGPNPVPVVDIYWYSYRLDTYYTASDPSAHELKLEQALCGYYGWQLIDATWLTNRSTYGKVTSMESAVEALTNTAILKRSTFSDGIASKPYFVNSFKVNFDNSSLTTEIEWMQETI